MERGGRAHQTRDPLKITLGSKMCQHGCKESEKCQLSRSWSPDLTFGLIRTAMVWGSRDSMKKVFKVCFSCCYRLICTQLCYSAFQRKLHFALLPRTKNHFLHQPSVPAQRPTTFGSISITENHAAHAPKITFSPP